MCWLKGLQVDLVWKEGQCKGMGCRCREVADGIPENGQKKGKICFCANILLLPSAAG